MTGLSRRGPCAGTASAVLVGGGIALGLAAGAALAAGRALRESVSRDPANNPRLINWRWARAIAVRGARDAHSDESSPVLDTPAKEAARREYAALVARSAELVSDYTQIELPAPLRQVHVFDRPDWVDANLAQFRLMFAPLDEAYAATIARAPGAAPAGMMGQAMLSGQMGILLGYLARRVLGQYDLSLLGREPVTEGRLYFVEPNIAAMERRYALPRDEFRAWIALHEVTHAFEFEAHPWVRAYMNDLLTEYLRSLSEDLFSTRPGGALTMLVGRIRDNLFERGHVLELMMSPAQREVFRKLQALMALMEGYSNHVMNRVGARQLRDHAQLKATFESRAKSRGAAEQLFIRLTGLDIKLEQYVLGEQFCERVVESGGLAALNRVWESPELLPTLDEIHAPDRWLARQARVARLAA
ncbi:MAG TPA: zinc-dependent metalloprotease [Chloroflexota bacterium]|nr:zinc-dependent metalloprotease [Chloroflexota bacterium]